MLFFLVRKSFRQKRRDSETAVGFLNFEQGRLYTFGRGWGFYCNNNPFMLSSDWRKALKIYDETPLSTLLQVFLWRKSLMWDMERSWYLMHILSIISAHFVFRLRGGSSNIKFPSERDRLPYLFNL